jgi:hypothetical protein
VYQNSHSLVLFRIYWFDLYLIMVSILYKDLMSILLG